MKRSRAHWLDYVAALASGRRRLFTGGYGDEALIERLATVTRFEEPPPAIEVRFKMPVVEGPVTISDGAFDAPVAELPREARRAVFRRLAPSAAGGRRPVFVVLASSGEEGYELRDKLFRPLVAEGGFEAIFLENALYGARRPEGQRGPNVRTVAEQVLMNVSMVEEARALIDWLARKRYDRIGIAGFSMGGSMAALVAAVTERPIAAAVFAAGRSGVPVFTEGLLARSIDFDALGGEGRDRLARIFGAADLHLHPPPRCPRATVLVGARQDGYVAAREVEALSACWPGSELRWVNTGHAGALLFRGEALRRAARDAMQRLPRSVEGALSR